MAIFFTFFYFLGPAFTWIIKKMFPTFMIDEAALEMEAQIDNYWRALDEHDKNWTIMEEANSRSLLSGIKIMTDESFDRLKKAKTTWGNTLMGTHSYDILANPLYCALFQYVSVTVPNRELYIIDDDSDEGNDMA